MITHYLKSKVFKPILQKSIGLLAAGVLLVPGLATAQMNGTYTINQNAGASNTNFRSFQALASQLTNNTRPDGGPTLGAGVSGPVTVNVVAGSGPYIERVLFGVINGVSATNTITINGNNNVIQYNSPSSGVFSVMELNGTDRLIVRDLVLRINNTAQGWGLHLWNSADDNIFERVDIDLSTVTSITTNAIGVVASGSTTTYTTQGANGLRNIFRNGIIRGGVNGGPYFAVSLYYQSGVWNSRWTFENNDIRDFNLYGVYAIFTGFDTFRGNRIRRSTRNYNSTFYGMLFSSGGKGTICENNWVYDMFGAQGTNGSGVVYGIYFASPQPANWSEAPIIRNNIIHVNKTSSTTYALFLSCTTFGRVYHNTIVTEHVNYTGGTNFGLYTANCSNETQEIYNNIVDMSGNVSNYKVGFYFVQSRPTAIFSNNNGLRAVGGGTTYHGYSATFYTSFADWQNADGRAYDQNSTNADPMFTNRAPANPNLLPNSVDHDGLGRGLSAWVPTDINGQSRSTSNPDPGAYEYNIDVRVTNVFTNKSLYCQNEIDSVRVTLANFSAINIPTLNIQYYVRNSAGNGTLITENRTVNLAPGNSTTLWFNTKYQFVTAGQNTIVTRIRGKQDSLTRVVDVGTAPVGAEIAQGSPFNGQFRGGSVAEPDIVAYGDRIRYSLTPAPGFPSSTFGSSWAISELEMRTLTGTGVLSSDTSTLLPNSTRNGSLDFTPSQSVTDNTYRVRMRLINLANGCNAPSIERIVFVAPRPVADFSVASACLGDRNAFVNLSQVSSGSLSHVWHFGDGDSSTLTNPMHRYAQPGTYTVRLLTRTNFGYIDTISKQATVYRLPDADFAFSNVCQGTAMPFTNNTVSYGGNPVYTWMFGDGNTSNVRDPRHNYSSPGVYQVTLSVNDNGCVGQKSSWVTYSPTPVADFSFMGGSCEGDMVSFNNASSISTGSFGMLWDFGDGGSSVQMNPEYAYMSAGDFNVKLTVKSEFGCNADKTLVVSVKENPRPAFTNSDPCSGAPVNFTNGTTGPAGSTLNYMWDFGDGNTSTAQNPVHTFGSPDRYNVKLRAVASNGCTNEIMQVVGTGVRPQAAYSVPAEQCQGTPFNFINNTLSFGEGVSFMWEFGDGSSSTDANPVKNFTNLGDFSVRMTATTTGGCIDSASGSVKVKEVPSSVFTVESNKDGNGTILIKPSVSNDGQYVWKLGTVATSNSPTQFTHRFFGSGLFRITLNRTKDGCSSTSFEDVRIDLTSVAGVDGSGVFTSLFPNPTNGKVVMALNGVDANDVNITVTDIRGRILNSVPVSAKSAGEISIDLSDLPGGVYLVNAVSGSYARVFKVEVVK